MSDGSIVAGSRRTRSGFGRRTDCDVAGRRSELYHVINPEERRPPRGQQDGLELKSHVQKLPKENTLPVRPSFAISSARSVTKLGCTSTLAIPETGYYHIL